MADSKAACSSADQDVLHAVPDRRLAVPSGVAPESGIAGIAVAIGVALPPTESDADGLRGLAAGEADDINSQPCRGEPAKTTVWSRRCSLSSDQTSRASWHM